MNHQKTSLTVRAARVRLKTVKSLYHAGSGHPGASLSIVDILVALYFQAMDLSGTPRDRFILSKGHAAPALYAVFAELGWIDDAELMSLRQPGTRLQGHPDMTRLPFLDAGSGALGQGLSIGIGYALAARIKKFPQRTYVIIGDGEVQEGQIWEAAMYAGAAGLDNLCVILDANGLQNETSVVKTLPIEPISDKWRAFGWHVVDAIDGHDFPAICSGLDEATRTRGKPTLVLARTVKGKGVPFMENDNSWHGKTVNTEQYKLACETLEKSMIAAAADDVMREVA